jgi:hypothetical protein
MSNRVNSNGFYEQTKHVIVELVLADVTKLNLEDPWKHSILLSLEIENSEAGFRLDLSSAYGLCGTIEAKELTLRITPGKPPSEVVGSS